MTVPAPLISKQSLDEIKFVSDVQAGREPAACPVCGSTDHPETRHRAETFGSKRKTALAVLTHIEGFIPAEMRADLNVTAHFGLHVQLATNDPDDGSALAVLCGLNREPRVHTPEGHEYVHHDWDGRFGVFDLRIAVLTKLPTGNDPTPADEKENTDGRA